MRITTCKSALFVFISLFLVLAPAYSATTINVGIYAPFSNEQAFIGRNMLGTLEEAREQIKSTDIQYNFYTLDQVSDPQDAAKTLQKFIDAHQINMLLTKGEDCGLLVSALAKKNHMIHFNLASNQKIADGANNFNVWNKEYEHTVEVIKDVKEHQGNQPRMSSNPHSTAALNKSMAKQMNELSPVSEAFALLHQGAVLALKNNKDCSSQHISEQMLALAGGKKDLGSIHLSNRNLMLAENNSKVRTA